MTPGELIAAGEAMFGPRWQSSLARRTGDDQSFICKCSRGVVPIPNRLGEAVVTAMEGRREELAKQIAQIERLLAERAG